MFERVARLPLAVAVSLVLTHAVLPVSAHERDEDDRRGERLASGIELKPLGSFDAGELGSAEITAYDARSHRLFVVNAQARSVDILDIRNPAAPVKVHTIDTSALGAPNSVDVHEGIVAVALENTPKTDPGKVAFYDVNGQLYSAVRVGALPDMLTFTPNGQFVLAANEGEPSGYGPGHVDPEGSVSIIPVPRGKGQLKKLSDASVRTASFTRFIGREAELRAQGVRIYGPGANAAQDFEPEYIAVADDGRTAYVSLQENNAIAQIDILNAEVTHVRALGFKDYSVPPQIAATYEWTRRPAIGAAAAGQTLTLGGFSGLAFEGVTSDGKLKFLTHTDRGPNGEPIGVNRPFLLPRFNPRLVRFTLDTKNGEFRIVEQIALKDAQGRRLTGVSNAVISSNASQPHNDEVPVDLFGRRLSLDPLGGDFEGVAIGTDGSFWMADEYRPAIYHFDDQGRLIERLIPFGAHAAAGYPTPVAGAAGPLGVEALPAVLGQRRQNRGFEAIVLQNEKIYAFVQSPLRNPESLSNAALNALRNVRVVEFDPATRATKQYLYVMDNPAPLGADDTRADKIGDAVAAPGGKILVIERDDDAVPEDAIEHITKKVYSLSLTGATDVSSLGLFDVAGVIKSVDQMTPAELAAVGVTPAQKTLYVDLAQAGYAGVEKVEGLALLDNGQLAVINDNDFGVAQIVIDNATGTFTLAPGYTPENIVLGIIDVPGLDASDRDSQINIRAWRVFGMYQPDAIATFKQRGERYLITANEGDARDWPGFSEESRVSGLTLDATAFPDSATLKSNGNLGRLNVTRTLGDTDADGDFDALYTLGGRSFSIWRTDGALVFDSGSQFERAIAAANPAFFNVSNDDRTFDSRSDNKGPEPEAVTVGKLGRRTYAFIGLERIGGVMAYDITNPLAPVFVNYANNRDFSIEPATAPEAKDLGPEGLIFIDEQDSPTREPLLIVANEVSGTVTIYSVAAKD